MCSQCELSKTFGMFINCFTNFLIVYNCFFVIAGPCITTFNLLPNFHQAAIIPFSAKASNPCGKTKTTFEEVVGYSISTSDFDNRVSSMIFGRICSSFSLETLCNRFKLALLEIWVRPSMELWSTFATKETKLESGLVPKTMRKPGGLALRSRNALPTMRTSFMRCIRTRCKSLDHLSRQ